MSVVLPTYLRADLLALQLAALLGQRFTQGFEVVVADNAGDPETSRAITAARSAGLDVRLVDASGQRGRSFACNAGVTAAQGSLIVFCDNDDIAEPEWLGAMVNALASYDMVAGPLVTDVINTDVDMVRARPSETSRGLPKSEGFLPWAVGSNLGIRKLVFCEVGGFSTDYLGGGEDVALSFRVQLAGHSLGYAPDAIMHYRLRGSARDLARQQYRYGVTRRRLERDFAYAGIPQTSAANAIRFATSLLIRSPKLVKSRQSRLSWIRSAANQAGLMSALIGEKWRPLADNLHKWQGRFRR